MAAPKGEPMQHYQAVWEKCIDLKVALDELIKDHFPEAGPEQRKLQSAMKQIEDVHKRNLQQWERADLEQLQAFSRRITKFLGQETGE